MNRQQICEHVGKLITGERNDTHGNSFKQFETAQALKVVIDVVGKAQLTIIERESLDMILTKISRIVNGTPIRDHWDDIIGYAAIAAESRDSVTPKITIPSHNRP